MIFFILQEFTRFFIEFLDYIFQYYEAIFDFKALHIFFFNSHLNTASPQEGKKIS